MKTKFKVGDVIRRKPLAAYNYERPIMKIVAIRKNLYVFEKKPLALEIVAQDEWELYNDSWWSRLREWLKAVYRRMTKKEKTEKGFKLKQVGQQRKRPGLTVFSYNKVTGEVVRYNGSNIVMNPDCIYRQALNKRNFVKRLKKDGVI